MPRDVSRLPACALALALLACGHSEPFAGTAPPEQDGPLATVMPVRLTFNDGMDQLGSFSSDGASLFYSFQAQVPLPPLPAPLRTDVDRCLGILPAAGGTRRELCRQDQANIDTTDSFEHPALGADGALLYGSYASRLGATLTERGALRLATIDAPWPGRVLLSTPTVVGGLSFDHIGVMRWASATTFYAVVGDQTLIGNPYNEIKSDTIFLGVGLLRGDLVAAGAVFTPIAGTDSATGFDFSAARDSLYFTRQDDATLYVVPIAGGVRKAVYSEAAGVRRILRDPVRIGSRIALVAQDFQQRLRIKSPPDLPQGIPDNTAVKLLDLSTGSATALATANGRANIQAGSLAGFGALAAAPDGCRLVVEHRIILRFSFTTDLYSYCLGPAGQCQCASS